MKVNASTALEMPCCTGAGIFFLAYVCQQRRIAADWLANVQIYIYICIYSLYVCLISVAMYLIRQVLLKLLWNVNESTLNYSKCPVEEPTGTFKSLINKQNNQMGVSKKRVP